MIRSKYLQLMIWEISFYSILINLCHKIFSGLKLKLLSVECSEASYFLYAVELPKPAYKYYTYIYIINITDLTRVEHCTNNTHDLKTLTLITHQS